MNNNFQKSLRDRGMQHRRTDPHTPPENGLAEGRNGVKDSLLEDWIESCVLQRSNSHS